jgi:hypothetical protein
VDTYVRNLNREFKWFDSDLFAKRDNGKVQVYRKKFRFLPWEYEGQTLLYQVSTPTLVFSLTDNWSVNGEPAEWGIEPILARLRSIDLINNPELSEWLFKQYEKSEESKERDFHNFSESFAKYYRRAFANTFNEINTSTMEKNDSRRKGDIKYGNRKS